MELRTERLILRPWTEEDAEDLYQYAKNPNVGPPAGWPVHTSVKNSRNIIKDILIVDNTFAVCLKKDNRAIGSIGFVSNLLSNACAGQKEVEIGYWIGEPFWGQGLIPEALKRMQCYAFEKLGCKAIWCGYYEGNEKSKRCQEKCGFVYHHTEKDKPCFLMGDIRTEHYCRLTKEEWETGVKNGCDKERAEISNKKKVVLYIHGKGGSAKEAEIYKKIFSGIDIAGLNYKTDIPWKNRAEIVGAARKLGEEYDEIILIANSIGAYFAMNALSEKNVAKAYFISPIVNMEKLIMNMMTWAGVTEEELRKRRTIDTDLGETLSWKYLCYAREHPVHWNVATDILYGEKDSLTMRETIEDFATGPNRSLTVLEGGEHWFHTDQQMEFLYKWLISKRSIQGIVKASII